MNYLTTDLIEALAEDALERFLVTQFLDYNQKFGIRCHRGFDQAKSELLHMFENLKM